MRVNKQSHKYGIRVLSSVREVYAIDKENNDTYWKDAKVEKWKILE